MHVAERMNLIRMLGMMQEHKEYSKKLGLRDVSEFRGSKKLNGTNVDDKDRGIML